MAYDPDPALVFAGWTSDLTNITLPIANVTDLAAADTAEGNGNGGDFRECLFRILAVAQANYAALAAADKPTKMALTLTERVDSDSGERITTYGCEFRTTNTGVEIPAE